jgi:alcohol dehydrogenase (NADP+)
MNSFVSTRMARAAVFGKTFRLALPMFGARSIATRATSYTLNTAAKIPALGFGTFQDPDSQEGSVSLALRKGMRLIDTARVYNVEEQVGKGIKKSGIPREDIFIGTKLWCNDYHPDDVERAVDDSLRDLDTPYVDLLLMHYPCTFKRGPNRFPRDAEGRMIPGETNFVQTWRAMEEVVKTGKIKAIGVSNFSKREIETLLEETGTVCDSRAIAKLKFTNSFARFLPFIKWKSTPIYSKR